MSYDQKTNQWINNNGGSLTLLSFVPAGIHVGQGDVGLTQTLNSLDQLASLLFDHIDDHLGFF